MKINFLNASTRSDDWLRAKIEKTKQMFNEWNVVMDYTISRANSPEPSDFISSNYRILDGEPIFTINYNYVTKQMLKIDSEDVGCICVICVDLGEKANCNYCFKAIEDYSVVPCLVVLDNNCEHYMRHEIIHSIHEYIARNGVKLPDTQDYDLVKAGLSYKIMTPEAMAIELNNLLDCMPYLYLLKRKPAKFNLLINLYSLLIMLLTKLVGLLKKKTDRQSLIEYTKKCCINKGMNSKIICAVIEAESNWDIKATNKNTNGTTDYGICQINDYWWIGSNSQSSRVNEYTFPNVSYVLDNPYKCIDWMVNQFKNNRANDWIAFKTGAYTKYLKNY